MPNNDVAEIVKVFIEPKFEPVDTGEGGIRRVVEAQMKYLPQYGCEVVDSAEKADLIAWHAGSYIRTDKPAVAHCHGLYWQEYDWNAWEHDLNRQVVEAMRRADIVTAPSHWVAYALQRGMMLDTPVLYHGVEADEWMPVTERKEPEYVLWNKTRPDPICDPEPLNRLAALRPDVQFVSTFGRQSENVSLIGKVNVDQMKNVVRNAAVYLATTRETFGIGTLEAMACEVPILGWNWGGQAEFIKHKVHGYLAHPGNYDDLLAGLEFCLKYRAELGKNARKLVLRDFTWQQAIAKYAVLYKDVVRKRAKQSLAPKVSVIITCHNLAHVLPRAVESVTTQEDFDQSDVEIVIVNDKSPDDTKDVADALAAKHKNIRILTNEDNLYLAGALNAGIGFSRGAYVIPLDADNELGPRTLRVLSDSLDNDRGIDIAYGAMELIDETGTNKPFISGWPGQFNFSEQMRHRNQIPSTSMYRRAVHERVGGYRSRCRTAEDADFWCRATSFGAVPKRVTDAVTLIYHDRPDSMSHRESDWDWTAWYPWSRDMKLTPFGAPQDSKIRLNVSSYHPIMVTVVIPVGPGHGKYVIDAVDSLIAQSRQDWYCIVVNDSGAPLPWLPPFVRVLSTGGNKGPAAARNMGIAQAGTPLFLPLDADDYLHPDALKMLLAEWEPTAKEYYYSDWYVQETNERKQAPEFSCEGMRSRLLHSVTALYPTAAWKAISGFDEGLESWEDWDFALSIIKAGYCGVRVPLPLFYYRMQAGSRREKLYANVNDSLVRIRAKWPALENTEVAMACGCQQTRVSRSSPTPTVIHDDSYAARMSGDAESLEGNLVKVEFLGTGGARTYRGESGSIYRFGSDEDHKEKYVRVQDLDRFRNRPDFKIYDAVEATMSDVQLVAPGPPR